MKKNEVLIIVFIICVIMDLLSSIESGNYLTNYILLGAGILLGGWKDE